MINFVTGWSKYLLSITDKESRRKAKICDKCDEIKRDSVYEVIKGDEIKEVSGAMCNKCKCPISAIIRSNKKCPLNKF